MGSTRKRTAGVSAFVLLSAGLFALPVLAQQGGQHSQREGVANSKAGDQTTPLNNLAVERGPRAAAGATVVDADAGAPVPSAPGAPAPAPGGGAGGGGASPAPAPAPPAVAPVGAAPATAPLGLSQDAPDVPPSLGTAQGGGSSSSPSPAATPEPSTLLLMGTGLVGLYRLRKRQ